MAIVPLPVFEAEADPKVRGLSEAEIAQHSAMKPPETVVVRYGYMKWIGEFPCRLEVKPGCGTKFVARTVRGTEIAEMLTSCSNGGCGHSLTRREMLEYIDKSGGKDYPFTTKGKVLRIASTEDLARQSALDQRKKDMRNRVKDAAHDLRMPMKVVEVEPILGEEVLTVYYMSEERVDFRDLVKVLAADFKTRIEMRQVGARDEARITADYERCGQHCCCQHFLKVLKPISMKNAKIQKATLDPLKISGRCGRLMCCLRYEEATYDELRKRLPHKKTRVNTPHGVGLVLETQIITQLVMVMLESDGSRVAVPVESISKADLLPKSGGSANLQRPQPGDGDANVKRSDDVESEDVLREMSEEEVERKIKREGRAEQGQGMSPQGEAHGLGRGAERGGQLQRNRGGGLGGGVRGSREAGRQRDTRRGGRGGEFHSGKTAEHRQSEFRARAQQQGESSPPGQIPGSAGAVQSQSGVRDDSEDRVPKADPVGGANRDTAQDKLKGVGGGTGSQVDDGSSNRAISGDVSDPEERIAFNTSDGEAISEGVEEKNIGGGGGRSPQGGPGSGRERRRRRRRRRGGRGGDGGGRVH